MKKTIQLGAALFALSFSTQAQPFTAQTFYDHSGTAALLSSGTYAVTNPGFIMVGYLPVAGGGGIPNYFLDKTDETGMLSGTGQFSGQYRMYTGGNLCVAALAQETNCYGLSVIERPTGGSILYAHAGAFDSGCVFATINNTGLPVSSAFYPFPSGASGITKPLIAASFTGDYYVCGSYMISSVQFMYAFKVTASGSTIWSQLYNLNASTTIPRGIIEETYSGAPELAVVGVENSTGSDNGFFMKIKGSSGAVTLLETIDSGSNEGLSSIALAASNNGFIVGGTTDMNATSGHAWMARLNFNGSIDWSTRIDPSTNTTAGDVVGVIERFSAFYGSTEYYGVTVSTGGSGGMLVLKLDDTGNAFSGGNNEFLYNDGSNIALPAAISFLDAGSGNKNSGIHVFGTHQNSPGNFFLNQACFNGATGNCGTTNQNLTTMSAVNAGPATIGFLQVNSNSGLSQCTSHAVSPGGITYAPNQPCSDTNFPSSPYTGNNNRHMQPTAIGEINMDKAGAVAVFPNPASNAAQITYNAGKGGEVTIDLYNTLGQHIKTIDQGYRNSGVNSVNVSLSALDLQTGIYLVNVSINGAISQQKIVFTKE